MLTTRRLVVAITFIGIFAMAARVSVDTDTWWHLRAGAWIVEHRAVPQTDPFSHTRAGAEWRYPGWLVEVPMYWLWTVAGYAGLNLFTAFFVTLAFAFVYLATDGDEFVRSFTLVLAAAASGVYWSARPQIVSFALAGAFVFILQRFRSGRGNLLWLLPPLMALWANSHGGFAIGFVLLALTLAGETGKVLWATVRQRNRVSGEAAQVWRRPGWLAAVGLACAVAVMLNPSGPVMLLYPFKTVSIGVLQDFIQEWQSPDFHQVEVQPFLWLLFATLGAVGLSGIRLDITDLLLVSGFGYLAFLAGRNVALFSLVAPPVLVEHAQAILSASVARGPRAPVAQGPRALSGGVFSVVNWLLLGLVALAALVKISVPLRTATNEQAIAERLPVGAAEFVRESRPPGLMFNSYNWGGYLVWTLYPDYPVFVDGRTDLYNDELLREYLNATFGKDGWEATLDRYGINLVLVESGSGLDRELGNSEAWVNAYRDAQAVVYERKGSATH